MRQKIFFVEPKKTEINTKRTAWFHVLTDGWQELVRSPLLRALTLDMVHIGIVSYFVIWLYQTKLKSIGIPSYTFGYFHIVVTFAQIFVLHFLTSFERLFGGEKKRIGVWTFTKNGDTCYCE